MIVMKSMNLGMMLRLKKKHNRGGDNMKKRTFICAMCKGEFDIDWTEEEAEAELKEEFGDINKEDCEQVCDDCWEKVKPKNNPKVFNEWKSHNQSA